MLEIINAGGHMVPDNGGVTSRSSLSLGIMFENIIACGHTQSTHTSISLM